MPIRPENRFFYPIDWSQLSDLIRLGRAMGECECCGRPRGQLMFHRSPASARAGDHICLLQRLCDY